MEKEIIEKLKTSAEEYGFDLSKFEKMCDFCKYTPTDPKATICKANIACHNVPAFDSEKSKNFFCPEFDI